MIANDNSPERYWAPHNPNLWPFHYATLKQDTVFRKWNGRGIGQSDFSEYVIPAGTEVKIVMASRFGDVGITTDLTALHGYDRRVNPDDLDPVDAPKSFG